MNRDREVEELRHIVEQVENKPQIRTDDPDVIFLRDILEHKISTLQTQIESTSESEP
jgi:hypothetical protein